MSQRLKHLSVLCLLAVLTLISSCRKSNYLIENLETITDQGGGTGTVTWTSDKEYIIHGFVFVNDGQTLTIEAGTVIRARTGQGSLASALIVARGGTIIAEGTQFKPIIFTVEGDDLKGSVPVEARGLWGGADYPWQCCHQYRIGRRYDRGHSHQRTPRGIWRN